MLRDGGHAAGRFGARPLCPPYGPRSITRGRWRRTGMTENRKVALVTGAARGIGLATAKKFLAEGWRVALLDIDGELLRAAVAAIGDAGNTLALHCDVSEAKGV